MLPATTFCTIKIDSGSEVSDEERLKLQRNLRKDLLVFSDVQHAEAAFASAPVGAKSSGIDLQSLVVTLAASGGVITTMIGVMQSWLSRREKTSVILEIGGDKLTITGASSDGERRLIEDWVSRHKS